MWQKMMFLDMMMEWHCCNMTNWVCIKNPTEVCCTPTSCACWSFFFIHCFYMVANLLFHTKTQEYLPKPPLFPSGLVRRRSHQKRCYHNIDGNKLGHPWGHLFFKWLVVLAVAAATMLAVLFVTRGGEVAVLP